MPRPWRALASLTTSGYISSKVIHLLLPPTSTNASRSGTTADEICRNSMVFMNSPTCGQGCAAEFYGKGRGEANGRARSPHRRKERESWDVRGSSRRKVSPGHSSAHVSALTPSLTEPVFRREDQRNHLFVGAIGRGLEGRLLAPVVSVQPQARL